MVLRKSFERFDVIFMVNENTDHRKRKEARNRSVIVKCAVLLNCRYYGVFQKFVPIVHCILRKAFNASLGKCTLIQVRNSSK